MQYLFCDLFSLATATAAKSLQSCPTLCNPIDGSPPGSAVPGILQARTLEWVAIPSPVHKSESEVPQSCPTLSDPMDRSLPGSSVHGIFQARTLEWVAISFSIVEASMWLIFECASNILESKVYSLIVEKFYIYIYYIQLTNYAVQVFYYLYCLFFAWSISYYKRCVRISHYDSGFLNLSS